MKKVIKAIAYWYLFIGLIIGPFYVFGSYQITEFINLPDVVASISVLSVIYLFILVFTWDEL